MVTVRLRDGKKVRIPDAQSVVVEEGGKIVLLDGARNTVREFPWVDVIAYSVNRS